MKLFSLIMALCFVCRGCSAVEFCSPEFMQTINTLPESCSGFSPSLVSYSSIETLNLVHTTVLLLDSLMD